jgi:hypothetical protein
MEPSSLKTPTLANNQRNFPVLWVQNGGTGRKNTTYNGHWTGRAQKEAYDGGTDDDVLNKQTSAPGRQVMLARDSNWSL